MKKKILRFFLNEYLEEILAWKLSPLRKWKYCEQLRLAKVPYNYALRNKKRAEKKTEMEKKEMQA